MPQSAFRRAARSVALVLAVVGVVWMVTLWVVGGFDAEWFGVTVTSNEPRRPMFLAIVAWTIVVALDGPRVWWARVLRLANPVDPRWVVAGVVAASVAVSAVYATTAASGADAFGYVSQADLWLAGRLKTPQPWVAGVPWPDAAFTFSPLGYRPAPDGEPAIVPTYAPGLPMLMAAAKGIGGQGAMFWIVPLATGALVLATYGLGRRLCSRGAGLVAAWLVATSPVVVYMSVWPMSDVPVAAAWITAIWLALSPGRIRAASAGALTAVAILVRPNLAFLAFSVAWFYGRRWSRAEAGTRIGAAVDGVIWAAPAVLGAMVVALINWRLYGSPTTSGYGDMGDMFEASHLWENLRLYTGWLVESHTCLPLVGLMALIVPARRLWPTAEARAVLPVACLSVATVWAFYCAYLVFDAWWYLRFLIVTLPFLMLGVGAVVEAVLALRRALPGLLAVGAIVVIGLLQLRFAIDHASLVMWEGEYRYAGAARLVRDVTDDRSVVLALQHSGSLRYYGGRMTVRYDLLDPEWLDRAIAWFRERGVRTYLLVQDYELPWFTARFPTQAAMVRTTQPRVLVYEGPSEISLFDLTDDRPVDAPVIVSPESYVGLRGASPAPALAFSLAGSAR